ncbi:serine hydrolase domain-containing protein [Nonomuraea roseoviolacea]|uniref:D-alanyl-D-alanine carboxypeptidase n=1 Tax=Nonomuraea roseoviolacea subsp. carminata TaxID=160689 RepID=A0ABT1JZ21_9ACTN|nr:serine hydrolase domain-containing protein [Nonomuraea roseoviolacea]MCP2346993.1 D-alanyl-D-alanine carboxypeptidase [Nonomuraea roseoviolacea subsp. carminata]
MIASRTAKTGLLIAATLVATALPASASPAAGHPEVRRVLDRAVDTKIAPGIVTEIQDGGSRWFGSAGVSDTRTGRKRHQNERFRIGSTSKCFTAAVVLKLAAEGRLSLDDTLDRWLPDLFDGTAYEPGEITVRQLLNQTSGIYAYTDDSSFFQRGVGEEWFKHRYDTYSPEQLVRIALEHPPTGRPGERFRYSNTNYILAALIVEKATGRTFAQELNRTVIRPLGLTGTSLPGTDPTIRGPHPVHYSTLFSTDPQPQIHDTTEMNQSFAWTAGGMISTTTDLNRFFSALLGGRLLPAAQLQEMLTTVPTDGSGWIPGTRYGLGVFEQKLPCGVTVWGNAGATYGSWSYAMGTRDGRHRVASHVNGDWAPLSVFADVLSAEFCPPTSR